MEVSGLEVPAALTPGNEHRCPLNTRLAGPQSRSGHLGEEKVSFFIRDSNPGKLSNIKNNWGLREWSVSIQMSVIALAEISSL